MKPMAALSGRRDAVADRQAHRVVVDLYRHGRTSLGWEDWKTSDKPSANALDDY
jgi:hypothetical protein